MRRRIAAATAVVLLAGACSVGGGGDADEILAETADRLGEIRSGRIDTALLVTPRRGDQYGFELRGPFALARDGRLPEMEVEYTQIANGERASVTLISDGERAWARTDTGLVELPPEQANLLRSAAGELVGPGGRGVEELPIDDWIVDAEVDDGGDVGGADTDRVTGDLDVVAAVNGLVDLARGFGTELPEIRGEDAEQLREATRNATFELYTGKDDRLLRRLTLRAVFGLDVPQELRDALGDAVGATVEFRLGVDRPNEPIAITTPR